MREILFKAKRKEDGEWVEGFYAKKHGIPYIYENADCPQSIYEIDADTLCQYTGLTDKNGRKIWENDILSCGGKLVVTWRENLASFCLSKEGWAYQHFFGEAVDAKDVEVIGNVFDNSELLEKAR